MNDLPHNAEELQEIYGRRFDATSAYRNETWKVLTSQFFAKYISTSATVLDLGCGYGEFINNIKCGLKLAMDLNPSAEGRLSSDVRLIRQDCSLRWDIPDESLDVVFTSNFFEHLPDKSTLGKTLDEVSRCLRAGGRLIAMGPNIKYLPGRYWDFWDHYLPLTELALNEALSIRGYAIEYSIGKFLPYTLVNAPRYPLIFLSLYLKLPFAWKVFGRQFLVIAKKK